MAFKLSIEPLANQDIQTEINYYNSRRKGLGKKYHAEIVTSFESIKSNPFFQAPLPVGGPNEGHRDCGSRGTV